MKILLLMLIVLLSSTKLYSFELYQFIIWDQYIDQNKKFYSDKKKFQEFLYQNKLQPINVLYHHKFLTQGKPDHEKIKKIADFSKKHPDILISFDIEIGNKFKPQTVLPVVNQTLDLYHFFGGKAPVGVYGILPQNIFGLESIDKNTKEKYMSLNKQYENIAKKIDFLSPVIYNLWFRDFDEWKERTDFHLSEGKKYSEKYQLKIIPYFSSSYLDKGFFKNKIIYPLSEQEMKKRLDYIKSKNVDGIIIWDSSIGILKDGRKPTFDSTHGVGKAILNFRKEL